MCLLGNKPLPRVRVKLESYKRLSGWTGLSPLPSRWSIPVGELSKSSSGAGPGKSPSRAWGRRLGRAEGRGEKKAEHSQQVDAEGEPWKVP